MEEKLIHKGWFSIVLGVLCIGTYFVVRGVLESTEMGSTLRVIVALIPAVPFAAFLWVFVGNIRLLDEMQRRIQLEAMAFAFPMSVLLLMVLGLLQLAVELPKEDLNYRHVWQFLPMLYFAGLALAWRRYK